MDVRPLAAYNGWRLDAHARGGHIPGAVALPESWLDVVDDADLVELLRSKHVDPGREVVVYGDRSDAVAPLLARLAGLGYHDASSYEAGWAEWAADETLSVEHLPGTKSSSTSPGSSKSSPETSPRLRPRRRFLLFHVNFGVPEEYAESHLRGPLPRHESAREPGRLESPHTRRAGRVVALARHRARHDRGSLRPGHRGRRGREVAGEASEARSPRVAPR